MLVVRVLLELQMSMEKPRFLVIYLFQEANKLQGPSEDQADYNTKLSDLQNEINENEIRERDGGDNRGNRSRDG